MSSAPYLRGIIVGRDGLDASVRLASEEEAAALATDQRVSLASVSRWRIADGLPVGRPIFMRGSDGAFHEVGIVDSYTVSLSIIDVTTFGSAHAQVIAGPREMALVFGVAAPW